MLNALKRLFSISRVEDDQVIEGKYFEKYKDILHQQKILQLIEEYKTGVIVFEPIRKTLTEKEQEVLYKKIDESDFLACQDKFETIIGLMMILDGSFPEATIVSRLGKVFGEEFMDTVEQKRNEFKTNIAVKRIIKYLKTKKD